MKQKTDEQGLAERLVHDESRCTEAHVQQPHIVAADLAPGILGYGPLLICQSIFEADAEGGQY